MNDEQIEQQIQAKGKTAPRVTPADIEANIAAETYFTAADGVRGADFALNFDVATVAPINPEQALRLLTFCVLVLRNGFTVTGESACASPENFDAELGRVVARQHAINKIWPLMGYALKERLHAQKDAPPTDPSLAPHQQRVVDEQRELGARIVKLSAFITGSNGVFLTLPVDEQNRLTAQLAAMTGYLAILDDRIAAFARVE